MEFICWKSIEHIQIGIGLLSEISNLNRKSESKFIAFDSIRWKCTQMQWKSAVRREINFSRSFSQLRMLINIRRAGQKKRQKLKTFWIFYQHFSFIPANDVCFLLLLFFYLSASQREERAKSANTLFFHVYKCFRYRITIPKTIPLRMSITGRQTFCIRAVLALFSDELIYAIRSEWFFTCFILFCSTFAPFFPQFLMQME